MCISAIRTWDRDLKSGAGVARTLRPSPTPDTTPDQTLLCTARSAGPPREGCRGRKLARTVVGSGLYILGLRPHQCSHGETS
jgi:hypothetical protein